MHESLEIFCCYTRKDQSLLLKLRAHLSSLEREGFIHIWHDRDISPGTEWEEEINKRLNTAHIILLLISPDFMAWRNLAYRHTYLAKPIIQIPPVLIGKDRFCGK